jgi:hypothetical protein
MSHHAAEHAKTVVDALAVVGWLAALTGLLTNVVGLGAAVGSFIWIWLRVCRDPDFRAWLQRRRKR